MAKKTGMVVRKEQSSIDSMIQAAIQQNVPVETMERLLSMRTQLKNEQAKAAFIGAMARFQSMCPVIQKTKPVYNKDGKTIRFKYAPIDSVIEQIKKPVGDNELSYTWDVNLETGEKQSHMKVVCKLTHVMGHTETSTFSVPVVMSEYMTSPQSYATAQTFAKRYTLLNVLGITTADEDTDATDTKKQNDAKSPKSKIMLRLRTLNEKTETKEQVEEAVKRLTQLPLEDKNFEEIAARLQSIIDERNEA